jgi:VanZ family protein
MALLFVLSSMPDLPSGPPGLTDKHAHSIAYAVLGGLLLRALSGAAWAGITWRRVAAAVALSTLYGVTDELHQWFVPGREASLADLAADAVGAGVAAVVLGAWAIIRPRR